MGGGGWGGGGVTAACNTTKDILHTDVITSVAKLIVHGTVGK